DILTGSAPQDLEDELDPEILMAYDLIDAGQLAERQHIRTRQTTAERVELVAHLPGQHAQIAGIDPHPAQAPGRGGAPAPPTPGPPAPAGRSASVDRPHVTTLDER
ncbi:hypothetical protein, partial [Nocardia abscessus]|uniref:hypothetical protein n=1 Tax=Nocardia abscessus TaxID=120957 RepID=UPI002457CE29